MDAATVYIFNAMPGQSVTGLFPVRRGEGGRALANAVQSSGGVSQNGFASESTWEAPRLKGLRSMGAARRLRGCALRRRNTDYRDGAGDCRRGAGV